MNGTEINVKFKNQVTGQAKLEKYADALERIYAFLDAIDSGKMKVIHQTGDATIKTQKAIEGIEKSSKNISGFATLVAGFKLAQKAVKSFGKAIQQSADYSENIDLFKVSMHGAEKEALKFVNTASEMYGLDDSALFRSIGVFKQMANAMGYAEETARALSLQLTQMQIDISSLYNVDVDRAGKVLQSAMSQQTEAIRALTGADITQMSLQGILYDAGIDRLVRGLTQAEKRLMIVVALTRQLQEAPGDFGRTIEGTAQQITVMKQQWGQLSRNIGSVFIPMITSVLPYLNAILMVINAIAKALAKLFGYKPEEHDMPKQLEQDFVGAAGGIDKAAASAKKLKSGLRGFDKLNNITTPTDTGGAGGGGAAIGNAVDPKIMDLFNEANKRYMDQLDKIEMTATRIRDRVMEWLGFTKYTDEVTGEVFFKFEKFKLGTLVGILLGVGTFWKTLVVISGVLSKIGIISKPLPPLFSVLGKIGKTVILPMFKTLGGVLLTAAKGIAAFFGISVGWLAAIAIAIAAVVALVVIYWDEIKEFFGGIWGTVVEFWEKTKEKFGELWDGFKEKFVDPVIEFFEMLADFVWEHAIEPIIKFFEPLLEAWKEIYQTIKKHFIDIGKTVFEGIVKFVTKVIEIGAKILEIFIALGKAFFDFIIMPVIKGIIEVYKFIFEKIINPIFDFIKSVFVFIYDKVIKPVIDILIKAGSFIYDKIIKPVIDGFAGILKFIIDVLNSVWTAAVNIVKKIGVTVADFIGGAIKGVVNTAFILIEKWINVFIKGINAAIKLINKIPGVKIEKMELLKMPRLKTGLDFVPNDYFPAFLDYGERVLTKEENIEYTKAISGGSQLGGNTSQAPIHLTVQVGDEVIAKKVIKDLSEMAKSNGRPIEIY